MKIKSLLLAAAISAASFSGVANAAIDGPQPSGASINSDLVLFIYDTAKDLSYVQNLNVNYNTILGLNGNFANSFALDASDLSIFSTSASSNLVWGMAASGMDFVEAEATGSGAKLGSVLTALNPAAAPADYAQIEAVNTKFTQLAVTANLDTVIGTANASEATGVAASTLSTSVKNFYNQVGGQVGFTNSANVSVAQNLWFVHLDAAYGSEDAPSLMSTYNGGLWSLDLAGATLSAPVAPVAPVPLPAAAWLMFSALMGLGGIARRRSAKV